MYIKNLIILFFIVISNLSVFSVEKFVDFDLIKKESGPRILSNGILISVSPEIGKRAFLRTNLDNWSQNYYFKQSLYGIYYLVLPYDLSKKQILYKLNIGGYYDRDPNNKDFIEDKYGTELSVVNVPKEIVYYQNMPIIDKIDERTSAVSFKYYNPKASEVNFVTSLDKWSQFSNEMHLNDGGYWEITMNFRNGQYGYYFLVDGKKITDIQNPKKMWDESAGNVSYFDIE
jgi:hypothetical protein